MTEPKRFQGVAPERVTMANTNATAYTARVRYIVAVASHGRYIVAVDSHGHCWEWDPEEGPTVVTNR